MRRTEVKSGSGEKRESGKPAGSRKPEGLPSWEGDAWKTGPTGQHPDATYSLRPPP